MHFLISIIIPVYNKEKYIKETINSVLNQTYSNFELILVDDYSSDTSIDLIKKFEDPRIKIISLLENKGVSNARNIGVENSFGRYVCFLDADDLWKQKKLENQLDFMLKNNYAFSFTDYEYMNEDSSATGRFAKIPDKLNYKEALKKTTIFTSSVMFDTYIINKKDLFMKDVPYEDTAKWWDILKKYNTAYGLQEVLVLYRTGHISLSSNKLIALKRAWNLYRNVENFSFFKSIYYFTFYFFNALIRRLF